MNGPDWYEGRGVHDVGGVDVGPFQASEHVYEPWEKRVHAIRELLPKKGLLRVDELRRAVEGLGQEAYCRLTYYEQWVTAIVQVMIEKGVFSIEEFGAKLAEAEQAAARHD